MLLESGIVCRKLDFRMADYVCFNSSSINCAIVRFLKGMSFSDYKNNAVIENTNLKNFFVAVIIGASVMKWQIYLLSDMF